MRYLLLPLLLVLSVVGCNANDSAINSANNSSDQTKKSSLDDESPTVSTLNEFCPIMGGEVVADGGSAEWNGKNIGFCCPGCEPKWEALSDEEKTEKLAAAGKKAVGDHDHKEHNKES